MKKLSNISIMDIHIFLEKIYKSRLLTVSCVILFFVAVSMEHYGVWLGALSTSILFLQLLLYGYDLLTSTVVKINKIVTNKLERINRKEKKENFYSRSAGKPTDNQNNISNSGITISWEKRTIETPYGYNDPRNDVYLNRLYRTEAIESGSTTAEWHCIKSFGCPHESHKKLNRRRFKLIIGMEDPDNIGLKIFPGEQNGCKCKISTIWH